MIKYAMSQPDDNVMVEGKIKNLNSSTPSTMKDVKSSTIEDRTHLSELNLEEDELFNLLDKNSN